MSFHPNATNDEFVEAARMGDIERVISLMTSGAATNESRKMLHTAAASGQVDVVECLIRMGVDVNVASSDGRTAL